MAVPDSMLLPWELDLVAKLARNDTDDISAMGEVADNIPNISFYDDIDHTLAAAERLVILARKAVELRDQRREDEARAEWGSKDSRPEVP